MAAGPAHMSAWTLSAPTNASALRVSSWLKMELPAFWLPAPSACMEATVMRRGTNASARPASRETYVRQVLQWCHASAGACHHRLSSSSYILLFTMLDINSLLER